MVLISLLYIYVRIKTKHAKKNGTTIDGPKSLNGQ